MSEVLRLTKSWLSLKRPNTRRAVSVALKSLAKFLSVSIRTYKDYPVSAPKPMQKILNIPPGKAVEYMSWLRKGHSLATVKGYLDRLHSWYQLLVMADVIARNPFSLPLKRFPSGRVSQVRPSRLIDASTILDRLAACPVDVRAAIACMIGAGLRRSEVLKLDVDHVLINGHVILSIVETKGGQDRLQPLPSPFAEMLLEHKNLCKNFLLFPMHERTLARRMNKYFDCHCHCARATYATQILKQTNDILLCAKALGHNSVKMVMSYDKRFNSLDNHPGWDLNYRFDQKKTKITY